MNNSSASASPFLRTLHLGALVLLGIAHPLLDILSHNPAYFVVNRSQRQDVVFLLIFFSLLLPLILGCVTEGLRRLNPRAGAWAFQILFHGLLLLMVMLALNRILAWNNLSCLVLGPIITAAIGIGYNRYESIRSFFTFLAPAILLVPAVFVLSPPVRAFLINSHDVTQLKPVNATTPVVLIVFDEFPLSSLLDGTNSIDATLYPNFARLAKTSTWYRNGSTVADYTVDAVPAILTGRYPRRDQVPAYYDHTDNLFTLLGGSYDVRSEEEVTSLCPETICGIRDDRNFLKRTVTTFKDLYGIYLHLVLPESMRAGLPPISERWIDIWTVDSSRMNVFDRFLASIRPQEKPALYYCHLELPHRPFVYSPSGTFRPHYLETVAGKIDAQWPGDKGAMSQYYGHLLQVRFVDKLVGDLMARLREAGLYDRSMIVITADHGICLRKGQGPRSVSRGNYQDVLLVPLFVKAPGQTDGIVDDSNVETIDILPTIADELGIRAPWTEGVSVLHGPQGDRKEKRAYAMEKYEIQTFPPRIAANPETMNAKLSLHKYLTDPTLLESGAVR